MPTTSVLSLGTRKDAPYWSDRSEKELKYQPTHMVAAGGPSLQQIKDVFAASDDWLFLGGHFTHRDHLYNEGGSVRVRFRSSGVVVDHPSGSGVELSRGVGFQQHRKLKALFWGGCDVHSHADTVKTMRALFGNPLMIGWHSLTGWEILYSVMGGAGNSHPNSSKDFFARVAGKADDAEAVRKAWLSTADDTHWGAFDPPIKSRFSVIMPDGREHRI